MLIKSFAFAMKMAALFAVATLAAGMNMDLTTSTTVYSTTPVLWEGAPNRGRHFKFNSRVLYSAAGVTLVLVLALM